MNYMSNVWKLYAVRFFHNLIPAYVIERLFWEQKGMTIQMVVYTEIIYALIIVLLEIPTGIIADKWTRKNMIILNAFFGCCEFVILIFACKFWHFAAAVFLAGIGSSACSGSENALLYDSLLQNKKEHFFEKCLGRLNIFDFSAAILAALCGSILADKFGFEFNYWLSFASMVISLFISFMLVEPKIKRNKNQNTRVMIYIKTSIKFFKNNKDVSLVLLFGMIMGAALNFIDEFGQLYLNEIGIKYKYFGLLSSGFILIKMPGNIFVNSIKKYFKYRKLLLLITAFFSIGFLCLSIFKAYFSLAAIALIYLFSGMTDAIVSGYLHHRIDSLMRATIDSFYSFGLRIAVIVSGLGFGYFSSKYDIFSGYGFIAFVCILFLVHFIMVSKKLLNNQ